MNVKCYHCKHEWKYKGKNPYYVTCPYCLRKVSLQKLKKESGESPTPSIKQNVKD